MELNFFPLPSYVTDIASIASILGLALTIAVYYETKSLKKTFKNKARIPELQKDLSTSASVLNDAMSDWENSKERIKNEFITCIATAESLLEKLEDVDKQKVRDFLNLIAPIEGRKKRSPKLTFNSLDDVWLLYEALSLLNSRLAQIVKDMKWD